MRAFTVIPAIDLKGGCCVRLRQGVASDQTVYSRDPVQTARYWESQGAELLHVVDLDGAFRGSPVHTGLMGKIAQAVGIPVQAGGGLRSEGQVRELLEGGVSRAILGTIAAGEAEDVKRLADIFHEKLAVGIDARNGRVQVKGWTEAVSEDFIAVAKRVEECGVKTLIYTNTATDGMLEGPDVSGVKAMCEKVQCDVIASGGVASREHVVALRGLNAGNLAGVIVGKALYEGTATFEELTRKGS